MVLQQKSQDVRQQSSIRSKTQPRWTIFVCMSYKLIDLTIPHSTGDLLLSSTQQPSFVQLSTKFLRCAYRPYPDASTDASTAYLTPVGELVTERYDPTDYPEVHNYSRYVLARTSTGGVAMFSPLPTTAPPHHSVAPSTWMDALDA